MEISLVTYLLVSLNESCIAGVQLQLQSLMFVSTGHDVEVFNSETGDKADGVKSENNQKPYSL